MEGSRYKDIRGAQEDGVVSVEEKEWDAIREIGKYWETRCAEYTQSKLFDEKLFGFLRLGIVLPPMKNGVQDDIISRTEIDI